jgi:hypothetical protein
MARARVFIKDGGPLSKQIGSRKFEGRAAHIITDPAEILAFKQNPMFFVEELDGEPVAPPKSEPEAAAKPVKGKPPKAPKGKKVVEEEVEEDDEEELDDEGEARDLSEDALRAMTKAQLAELAEELGIKGVDATQNKDDMMARIRTARKE